MADRTPHQKSIIRNYYDNKDTILVDRLQNALSELYLATSDKKRDSLWRSVETALRQTSVHNADIEFVMQKRDLQHLGKMIQSLF